MKKLVLVLASVLLGAVAFTGCAGGKNADTLTVVVPNGSPALSLSEMITDYPELSGKKLVYKVVQPDNIAGFVINGEADIAILPTNGAAKLYTSGSAAIKMVATTVQGCLYMLSTETADSLEDLQGKVVTSIGQGNMPDLVFRYILESKKIPYAVSETAVPGKVALSYVASGDLLIPPLAVTGKIKYGVLAEPAVSQALAKGKDIGLDQIFDLQELWREVTGSVTGYPLSCLVVKSSLIESDRDFVNSFVQKAGNVNAWLESESNASRAQAAIKAAGGSIPILTPETILRANLAIIESQKARADVERYMDVLDVSAIGGKLPDDGFYYAA